MIDEALTQPEIPPEQLFTEFIFDAHMPAMMRMLLLTYK